MKRHGPVKVVFYLPTTESAKNELAQRVAQIHAEAVNRRIGNLRCTDRQKRDLLDAVIETAKKSVKNSEKAP